MKKANQTEQRTNDQQNSLLTSHEYTARAAQSNCVVRRGLIQSLKKRYFSVVYIRHCLSKLEIRFKHHSSLWMILPQQPAQILLRSRMVESNTVFTSPACLKNGVLGFLLARWWVSESCHWFGITSIAEVAREKIADGKLPNTVPERLVAIPVPGKITISREETAKWFAEVHKILDKNY